MSVKVFDLLTATPAPVSGKPEPTRTFQWLRNGTAISGANAQTYMLQPADEGALVAVRQIETNLIGKATATSATVGPIIPDTTALDYIAAVEAADGEPLEEGVKQAYIDFIVGCKQDGIFQSLKASCIMAGARTLEGALVPLVGDAPTNFNFVPADYDRVTGLKGDGSTKYLDSNRNNNADPQNSNHNVVFVTEIGTGSPLSVTHGSSTPNGANHLFITSDLVYFVRNRNGSLDVVADFSELVAFEKQFLGHSRSENDSYTGRALGQNSNFVRSSQETFSGNMFVFERRPGSNEKFNGRLSFYSIGEAIDLEALDTRVSNLMIAIDEALT